MDSSSTDSNNLFVGYKIPTFPVIGLEGSLDSVILTRFSHMILFEPDESNPYSHNLLPETMLLYVCLYSYVPVTFTHALSPNKM
jgi:hypothetical protein